MIIQPGAFGIDAYSRPKPTLVKAAGGSFVCVYIYGNGKGATIAEIQAEWDAGLGVVMNYEASGSLAELSGGAPSGFFHATRAVGYAKALKAPAGEVIIFSDDTGDYVGAFVDYFKTAEQVTRGAGFGFGYYGGKDCYGACIAAGIKFDLVWATNATDWGQPDNPHIKQLGHNDKPYFDTSSFGPYGSVDVNIAMRTFHAWGPTPDVAPEPTLPPLHPATDLTEDEDNMQVNKIAFDGFANQFLVSANGYVHLSGKLANETYAALPLDHIDAHPQAMKAAAHDNGMDLTDWVPTDPVNPATVPYT